MNNVLFSSIELPVLIESLRSVIRDEIQASKLKEMDEEKLLSPNEVLKLLSISRPTLISWTRKGSLKEYRMGSTIYYKRSEIMGSLISLEKYKTH